MDSRLGKKLRTFGKMVMFSFSKLSSTRYLAPVPFIRQRTHCTACRTQVDMRYSLMKIYQYSASFIATKTCSSSIHTQMSILNRKKRHSSIHCESLQNTKSLGLSKPGEQILFVHGLLPPSAS